MVIPCKSLDTKEVIEKEIWEKMKGDSFEGIMSFHSFFLDEERMQLVISDVSKGIILAEIRDYQAGNIAGVQDKKYIRICNEPPVLAPTYVGMQHRQHFLDAIKKTGISPKAVGISSLFPNLSHEEFIASGLNKVCPESYSILKDDFDDGRALRIKIDKMFDGIFNSLSDDDRIGLDKKIESVQKELKKLFPKNEIGQETLSKEIEVHTKKQQYYEIAKFLMRNKVREGIVICQSKELLDGLGDYFSDIALPWHYKEAEEITGTAGYCLTDRPLEQKSDKANVLIDRVSRDRIRIFVNENATLPIKISEENVNIDFDIEKIPLHLKNEEIRAVFMKSFEVAKEEIDIICPWMNFGVVNEAFIDLMDNALKRGVRIKIEYGLNPNQNEYDISRSLRSDEVANRLRNEFEKYGNSFQIRRDNIHYKLVLCDELFKLEGGFNYLSFLGDYSEKGTRREGSPFGRDKKEIKYLRKEYFEDGWKP